MQKKGFYIEKKFIEERELEKFQIHLLSCINDIYPNMVDSFESLREVNPDLLDMVEINKRFFYSMFFFKFINSDSFISFLKDKVIDNEKFDIHPSLNIRINPPYIENENDSKIKFAKFLDWHQDVNTMTDDSFNTPIFTFWLPLTEAVGDDGGIDVIEYEHKIDFHLNYNKDTFLTDKKEINLNKIKKLDLSKGDLVVFDKFLLHKTRQNLSNRNRISIDFRIYKTDLPNGRRGISSFTIDKNNDTKIYEEWINNNKYFLNHV